MLAIQAWALSTKEDGEAGGCDGCNDSWEIFGTSGGAIDGLVKWPGCRCGLEKTASIDWFRCGSVVDHG